MLQPSVMKFLRSLIYCNFARFLTSSRSRTITLPIPQTLVNVPIQQKIDIEQSKGIKEAISDAESQLADSGRVLLRPSGTEPLIRVMVEGVDAPQVRTLAEQIASVVSAECTV